MDSKALLNYLPKVRIEDFSGLLQRADELKSQGKIDAALDVYGGLSALKPWDTNILNDRMKLLEGAGRFEDAIKELDVIYGKTAAALPSQPAYENILKSLQLSNQLKKGMLHGSWWRKEGNIQHLENSMEYFLQFLAQNPAEVAVHGHMQARLLEASHFEMAKHSGELTFRLHTFVKEKRFSRLPMARTVVMAGLMAGKDTDNPRQILKAAWEEEPDKTAEQWICYKLMMGEPVAEKEMDSALQKGEEAAKIHFLSGTRSLEQGNKTKARQSFQAGVQTGDYLFLNRQALARLDGKWTPLEIKAGLLDAYASLLDKIEGVMNK